MRISDWSSDVCSSVLAVRERVGDMYLVHGGDMKGIERIAASWAEQNGIQQVRFGLDRKLGDRAGFRRNEQMLSLKPRYVIAFQGNGVTVRLVIEAKTLNIRVVDRRGPLGPPPPALTPGQARTVDGKCRAAGRRRRPSPFTASVSTSTT